MQIWKDFIKRCKRSILFYTFIYAILWIVSKLILNAVGMEYRQYMNYFSIIFILIGIIAGVIQIFVKSKSKSIRICIIVCSICIIGVMLIGSPIILLFVAFLPPEHIVEKDNKKYVAHVYSWLDTRVEYYDYVNFFLRGKTEKIEESYYNIGRDVLEEDIKDKYHPSSTTYYDENGKVINIDSNSSNEDNRYQQEYTEPIEQQEEKNETIIPSSDDDILYEKEIDENTMIRVRNLGAILAQRSIVAVEKSTDGGKTYSSQNSEGIQIHNGASFVFLDENIGFINDPGLAGTNGENRGLLITVDGGKVFTDTNIIHPTTIEEKNLFVNGVPYIEDGLLKVEIYTINNNQYPEKTYYEFISNDNGITWECNGKKME